MPQRISVVDAAVYLRTSVAGILDRVASGELACDEDCDGHLWVVLPDDTDAGEPATPPLTPVPPDPSMDAPQDLSGEAFRSRLKALHARHLGEMADLQARHQAERERAWDTYRLEKERLLAANRPIGENVDGPADDRVSRLEGKS